MSSKAGRIYCVLDGLDEVRPKLRDEVHRDINRFYASYFSQNPNATLIVSCRKEAYRAIPLDIPDVREVRPLTDQQLRKLTEKWPPGFPTGKSADSFLRDLAATPRILELARSSLLLVGGLMQYTESNLGIPEERVEYLSRVAKWLVVDWATAQGHPPDPYRQVYERLLARIAFHLHRDQKTDCLKSEAHELLRRWLPSLGYPPADAHTVLDQIATKTGILVTDDENTVVFAQFGLQEYYASLELLAQTKLEQVGKLEPKSWWREVVLLTAAQQREPTPFLERLFVDDPLLAAAAVAECATPATVLQERAIAACINAVDAADKTVGTALVSLLRKVRDPLEGQLCDALEKRVSSSPDTAVVVGRALAVAGTERATATLARHPEAWEACLKDAGYLSASFENLLVGWMQKGDELQSERAADLLSLRLSTDRFRELVDLLPSMPEHRSDRLAGLLIRHLEAREPQFYPRFYADESSLWVVGTCVPYIKERDKYLSRRRSSSAHDRGFSTPEPDLVATALFLEERGKRCDGRKVLRHLFNCLAWSRQRGSLLAWSAAAVLFLTIDLFGVFLLPMLAVTIALALAGTSRPTGGLPWWPRLRFGHQLSTPINAMLLLLGASLALTAGARVPGAPVEASREVATAAGGALLLLMGIVLSKSSRVHYPALDFGGPDIKRHLTLRRAFVPVSTSIVVLVAAGVHILEGSATAVAVASTAAVGALLWCAYAITVLLWSVYLASAAGERASKSMAETLK